jgi:hypothetical protein
MKRLIPLLCLISGAARAADPDRSTEVAVSSSTPTALPATTCTTCTVILIENGGPNDIFCSPESDVTTLTGFRVAANDGYRSFPNVPLWCIAETADQSASTADRDHTIVWPTRG